MPSFVRLVAPLVLLLVLVPDCARDSGGAHGASPPANSSVPAALSATALATTSGTPLGSPTETPPGSPTTTPAARGVVRMFVPASSETIRLSPDLGAESEHPHPTADYPSLEAARDSIGAMLRRLVNAADPAVRVNLEPARFKYWYAADSADGWAFHIVVTDTSDCPNERLQDALQAAGWAPYYGYATDGPDGGTLGLVSRRFLCIVEGRWDGGDDSDTTYVPLPGCDVTVTCVPRREDDVPKW